MSAKRAVSSTPPEADPRAWMERARGDVEVAERILAVAHLAWAAGFHLQQAAEKALKAVLVARGRFPPKVHDLMTLADQVVAIEPALAGWGARLVELNEYSVAHRYPVPGRRQRDLGPAAEAVRRLLVAVDAILAR